jgi:hypothetical protein
LAVHFCYDAKGGGEMDKLKKYAGYAGLGYGGGLITAIIGYSIDPGSGDFPGYFILAYPLVVVALLAWGLSYSVGVTCPTTFFLILIFISPFLGGFLGGEIAKKWWGAILGGAIGFPLITIVVTKLIEILC